MQIPRIDGARKPKIWAISYKRLSRLIDSIIPSYAPYADIRIIDRTFEDALETARELERAGEVDVFLSAGANGAYLRNNVTVPVALVKVTGFDILLALAKARQVSERIAIVTYQAISTELEEVKQLLNLDIEQRSYSTIDDAKDQFQALAAAGYRVIVGSSLITDLAEQAGLTGIFAYSPNSVRQAFDDALEIARIAQIEEARRERLNTILRHLNEGVLAVDMAERIQSLNPAMERLLGVRSERVMGKPLSEVAPELNLSHTLHTGTAELAQIEKVGHMTVVVNRTPITERGLQTGAVLTCQDSTAIQRADRNIRSHNRPRNFVAKYHLSQIIGESPAIRHAKLLALQYAQTDSTALITGESGTGKELFAQGIHNASRRKNHPFVAINCAAFPESLLESELFGYEEGAFSGARRGGKAGLFESAHTGTIFLDEIGDMPLALQTRLLRALQEKEILRLGSNDLTPVDVRVIAATNCDLKRKIAEGRFREDLFYRLNILHIDLPPLRERREDILPIAAHLFGEALRRIGALRRRDELMAVLLPRFEHYPWPGNIREMENVIERITVLCQSSDTIETFNEKTLRTITPELFIANATPGTREDPLSSLHHLRQDSETDYIEQVLGKCNGNHVEAAKILGISRVTLWRKLKRSHKDENATSKM